MKKNLLLYLLMGMFSFGLFTACGDDDDPEPDPGPDPGPDPTEITWKDVKGTFSSDKLTINGKAATTANTVILAESGDNAKFTITNVVPENAEIVFENVSMTKTSAKDAYDFTSSTAVNGSTLSLSGKLKGDFGTKADAKVYTMEVTVTRKVASEVVGTWNLNFLDEGEEIAADFRMQIKGLDPMLDNMSGFISTMVGGLIVEKVEAVNVKLSDAGIFDVSWRPVGASADVKLVDVIKGLAPESVAGIIDGLFVIEYYAVDGKFYLALNKTLLAVAETAMEEKYDEMVKPFLTLMEDKGAYYVLPINMELEGDNAHFFMSKDFIIKATPMILPMFEDKIPEEYKSLVNDTIAS